MTKQTLSYFQLPLECKKALLEYCYMDVETMEEIKNFYRDKTFTLEMISIEEAKKRCMEHMSDWSWDCKTFEEYHKVYVGDSSDILNHGDSMYPVIEGGDEEWLDDGWHRFHSYIKYEKSYIPVLNIL